jgi:phosphopantothenoylcysteine synthetase/decarboxylase
VDAYPRASGRVLYVVACAAQPARDIGTLVELEQRRGWAVCVIATPRAATWLDVALLERQTGYPVRSDYKRPDEPDVLPKPDAVAAVPATFNTINKWAAGISDTLALGILNEAVGLGLPTAVVPYVSPGLAAHPAYARSLDVLRDCGVRLVPAEGLQPAEPGGPYRWPAIAAALTP